MSACQEIGLEYYTGMSALLPAQMALDFITMTDINSRMPRSEAGDIFGLIKPIGQSLLTSMSDAIEQCHLALSIDPKLFIEIMGSYRR